MEENKKKKIKKYTNDSVKNCTDRVFGIISQFKTYAIKAYVSDAENNLIEIPIENIKDYNNYQLRIIGKDKCNEKYKYISVNQYDFLKEAKKIGRELCDELFKELTPLISNDNIYWAIETSLIKSNNLINHLSKIKSKIDPFLTKYGFPIDFNDFSSIDNSCTNSIDLEILCTYFILIHIISDLAGHYNKGQHIIKYYELLGLPDNINKIDLIEKLLNPQFTTIHQLEKFKLKFVNNYPIYYTSNLFSFAYERLKLNIVQKTNNNEELYRTDLDGIISQKNTKGVNARARKKALKDMSTEERKKYDCNKSNEYYENKIKYGKNILNKIHFIELNDIHDKYTDLVNYSKKEIKQAKDYRCSKHEQLYIKVHRAYKDLKNDRN